MGYQQEEGGRWCRGVGKGLGRLVRTVTALKILAMGGTGQMAFPGDQGGALPGPWDSQT